MITWHARYIIERGLMARLGRVLGRGRTVGEDMILSNSRRHYSARALTYLQVQALRREDLFYILEKGDFPITKRNIRKARCCRGVGGRRL